MKIKGYSRRIDWLLTEKPKTKGKHEQNTHFNKFFSGFGELGHLMIYWLTTIKSQIAKKHSIKTRKKKFVAARKKMVKKSP